MNSALPADVQMQLLRPQQLEERARDFPVVYVPFGLIEWHGRHLPLGTDALKAHAVLIKTAEQSGGVVYPPFYMHNGFRHSVPLLTEVFERLKGTGFRVILGVSGHNVQAMIDMIDQALVPVVADGTCAGEGLWEMSLCRGPEADSDHAAKWETSHMMFFHGDRVDLVALGDGPISRRTYESQEGEPQSGIGGLDPRTHASAEVGRRCAQLASSSIGERARQLLASLPPEHRAFACPAITPRHWWYV